MNNIRVSSMLIPALCASLLASTVALAEDNGIPSFVEGNRAPKGYARPKNDPAKYRLDFFFHGRSENLTELNFISGKTPDSPTMPPDDKRFVVFPYGRYCNANKFAGEIDTFEILDQMKREYPIDEGKKLMLEAVKPLGEDYVKAMREGLEHRWMDVYPRPRKLSGAHMAGAAYDVHPYLLINYTGNYESVSTIAHEWGHAMHTYLSNRGQPFVTSRYPIFIAEIASTLNEALLLDHVLKTAKDDDERLLYLGSALETLRGTFYRQVMLAEFEREAHARVDKGEAMTGDKLTKIYAEIIRKYHGDAQGVVKIDDLYSIEWAYIPHFYNAFYVFQYATSVSAGSLFADDILSGKPGAREKYLKLISSGGSDYPYELVKAAGVDLATAAPYDAVARRMNKIMDEMEALVAKRKG